MDTKSNPASWVNKRPYEFRISWNDRSRLDKLAKRANQTLPSIIGELLHSTQRVSMMVDDYGEDIARLKRGRYGYIMPVEEYERLEKIASNSRLSKPDVICSLIRRAAREHGIEPDDFPVV